MNPSANPALKKRAGIAVELSGARAQLKQAFQPTEVGRSKGALPVADRCQLAHVSHHFARLFFPVGYALFAVRFQQGWRHGIAIATANLFGPSQV